MAIKVLITDMDNTLYDWVGYYVPSFLAMVTEISRLSGVSPAELKKDFRLVHQRHKTTEYAFAIEELNVLAEIDPHLSPGDRIKKYDSAIYAFRSTRKKLLKTYPGVSETLLKLHEKGIRLVAHSDAMSSYASRRLRQLGIDILFDALCASRDHGIPEYLPVAVARIASDDAVLGRMPIFEFPPAVRKPNPEALHTVFRELNIDPKECLYVGDSLTRDVLLARRAGVQEVWAAYGHTTDAKYYRELLNITAWTDAEVGEEEKLKNEVSTLRPSYTITTFKEILEIIGVV